MKFTLIDVGSFNEFFIDVDMGGQVCVYDEELDVQDKEFNGDLKDYYVSEAIACDWFWRCDGDPTDFYCKDEQDNVFLSVGEYFKNSVFCKNYDFEEFGLVKTSPRNHSRRTSFYKE